MKTFPQTLGVRETTSQIEIGKISINVLNNRVQITISDSFSTFSTSIHLLPVDAANVVSYINEAIEQINDNQHRSL